MSEFKDLDSFETFLAIVARLRAPNGCPWDREQTHESLRRYLLEECHEALEAIEAGNPKRLAEELGDVLLQVGLHAQIGQEHGAFSIQDVLRNINTKLIRRHPHVFGDWKAAKASDVEANWEKLKRAERKDGESTLSGVPKSLPALAYSQEVQGRAARVGFDWPDMQGVLAKVREELDEFSRAKDKAELEHELGDIFAALVNVGRKLGIDSEGALRKASGRFRERFGYMEAAARRQGRSIEQLSLEEQEALWQEAKRAERGGDKPSA
jgi:tetrapyrrole methylase family protein/MazG family protein